MKKRVAIFNKHKGNKYLFVFVCILLLFFFFIVTKNSNSFSMTVYANAGQTFSYRVKPPTGDYFTVKGGAEYIFEIENILSEPSIEFYFIPEDPVKFKNYGIASQENPVELNSYINGDINKGSTLKDENGKWIFSLVFKTNGTFYADVSYDDNQEEIIVYIEKIDIDAPIITNIYDIDFDITPYGRIYKVPFSDEPKALSGSKSGIKKVDVIKDKKAVSSPFDQELYRLLTDIKPLDSFDSYLTLTGMYDNKFNHIDWISATLEDGYYKFNVAESARYYLRVEDNAGNVNYYFFLNYNTEEKDFRYYVDMYIGEELERVYVKPLFDNYILLLEENKDLTKIEKYQSFLDAYYKEVKVFELGSYENGSKLESYQQMQENKRELDNLYKLPQVNYYLNGELQTNIENNSNMNLQFEILNLFENIKNFKYGEKVDVFFTLKPKSIRNMPSLSPNRSYYLLINVKKDDLDCEFIENKILVKFRFTSNIKDVKFNNQLLKNRAEKEVYINDNLIIEIFDVQYAKTFNIAYYSISAGVFVTVFVFYLLIIIKKFKGLCFSNYFKLSN